MAYNLWRRLALPKRIDNWSLTSLQQRGSIPADTGLPGDVGEGAITGVVVKHVLTPISDEQVFKPVVVVIADANTGRPTRTEQTGFCRHIGEGAIPVGLVQAVRGAFRSGLESCPAEDENVEPAVIIVIEQGASAAHRFHDVVLSGNAAIDGGRMQAGRFRHIGESGEKRNAGGFTPRRGFHSSGSRALRGEADSVQ